MQFAASAVSPREVSRGPGPVQVLLPGPASQLQLLLAESFRPLREVGLPLASPSHVSLPPCWAGNPGPQQQVG